MPITFNKTLTKKIIFAYVFRGAITLQELLISHINEVPITFMLPHLTSSFSKQPNKYLRMLESGKNI